MLLTSSYPRPGHYIYWLDMSLFKKGLAIFPNFTSLIILSLAVSRNCKTDFKFFESPPILDFYNQV